MAITIGRSPVKRRRSPKRRSPARKRKSPARKRKSPARKRKSPARKLTNQKSEGNELIFDEERCIYMVKNAARSIDEITFDELKRMFCDNREDRKKLTQGLIGTVKGPIVPYSSCVKLVNFSGANKDDVEKVCNDSLTRQLLTKKFFEPYY